MGLSDIYQRLADKGGPSYRELVKQAKESFQPKPWGVLYNGPNSDGTRKNCKNCFLWCQTEQCMIFPATKKITGDMVCGYHVTGVPQEQWVDRGVDYVDEYTSGLERVPKGTSCDTCRYYEGTDKAGTCFIVQQESGSQAEVKALGCCAAWEKGSGA